MKVPFLGALFAALAGFASTAEAACRQALLLALDVSGSVDAVEYRLQLDGLAAALEDPAVASALLAQPHAPVEIAVFEWSASDFQRRVLPWTAIENAGTITTVAAHLRGWQRQAAPQSTGLGAAMLTGTEMLGQRQDCWRRTLDISGDGKNNDWPEPAFVKSRGLPADLTINALVIGTEVLRGDDARQGNIAELQSYFSAEVIYGPESFVEVALGYEAYRVAMTRKLLRELSTLAVGDAGQPPVRLADRQ
ncbi:MAG: DUF1194 domain-containing protein [Pseudomonadota bacterium]